MINVSREEGYDISFRFKSTLPDGLLAIGKGPTFYILQLQQGRLNLQSSILNKLEGVFIGSGLNNSSWQKVSDRHSPSMIPDISHQFNLNYDQQRTIEMDIGKE